jgi:microcystin degradation protein MlrC
LQTFLGGSYTRKKDRENICDIFSKPIEIEKKTLGACLRRMATKSALPLLVAGARGYIGFDRKPLQTIFYATNTPTALKPSKEAEIKHQKKVKGGSQKTHYFVCFKIADIWECETRPMPAFFAHSPKQAGQRAAHTFRASL